MPKKKTETFAIKFHPNMSAPLVAFNSSQFMRRYFNIYNKIILRYEIYELPVVACGLWSGQRKLAAAFWRSEGHVVISSSMFCLFISKTARRWKTTAAKPIEILGFRRHSAVWSTSNCRSCAEIGLGLFVTILTTHECISSWTSISCRSVYIREF